LEGKIQKKKKKEEANQCQTRENQAKKKNESKVRKTILKAQINPSRQGKKFLI